MQFIDKGKKMHDETEKYVDEINTLLKNIKVGSLCFFGIWFGKPYDNWHHVVKADGIDNVLRITFSKGETLEVSNPKFCKFSSTQFEILQAQRVLWRWYSYGTEMTDLHLYYYEFEVVGQKIKMMTNANWVIEKQNPKITEPAVKMY